VVAAASFGVAAAIASGDKGSSTTRKTSSGAPPLTGGNRQSSSPAASWWSGFTYSWPTANSVNGRNAASSGWRAATADHAASTVPPGGRSISIRSRPAASRYRAKKRTRTRTAGISV